LYGAQQDIIKIILTLLGVLTVGVVFKYVVGLASGKFGMYTIRDIRTALAKHIESLPMSYFEAAHSATMVTKLSSDCNTIQGLLQETIPGLLYNGLVFVFAFIYLFRLNWSMLIIAVAFTPITIYMINRLNRPLGK
jgi:ABC-type multidrug transport system fused ATPase/permease subunit